MNLEMAKIFVKVAQNGSFSKAAQQLNVPKSTISKSITRLEQESGTKLIVRTTRSLSLTESGRAFYEQCMGPLQALEDAHKSLLGGDQQLSGLVRITAPEDLGAHVISRAIAQLSQKHKQLSFELNYTDEIIDLVKEGFDIAVRIGTLNESSLKAKKAGEVNLIMVASPKYLQTVPKIRHPQDLIHVDALTYSDPLYRKWKLKSATGRAHVAIAKKISSNQMSSLLNMALEGGGVALVPMYLCDPYIQAGRLIRVLPDWSCPGLPVSVVSPLGSSSSKRLKLTIEWLLSFLLKEMN